MINQKRNYLSSSLKEENDLEFQRRAGGKLFHARGPATANARSPIDARRVVQWRSIRACKACSARRPIVVGRGEGQTNPVWGREKGCLESVYTGLLQPFYATGVVWLASRVSSSPSFPVRLTHR